jgi:ABC-type Fe3+ transport system substrate-binding protein
MPGNAGADRPPEDLFWGGESALYDRLAAQGLLAPLELPKAVTDAIPLALGKNKPVSFELLRVRGSSRGVRHQVSGAENRLDHFRPRGRPEGAKHPKAARAFIEFLLSERGQRIAIERGLFPIVPYYRIEGPPGSTAEIAVEFNGGVRSYYEVEVISVYDDALAQKRYEQVNATFRREIETVAEALKKKY